MPNIFQGSELQIASGISGFFSCEKIQSLNISLQNNRQETTYLGNFNSEQKKPIINYTPVQLSFSYIKPVSNQIEENLGLLNPSGCFINLIANNNINNYSSRDYKILFRPPNKQIYNGQINLYSGYLSQYSLSANVGAPITCSVNAECLDTQSFFNNSGQSTIQNSRIAIPEGLTITGINFSGMGISGLQIQNFSLNLTIQRNNSFQIGKKFPEKTIVQTNGNIQIGGFLNNITEINKLSEIDSGSPIDDIYINIKDSCSNSGIMSILVRKPYLESKQISNQVGNLANTSLNFSVKPTIKLNEISGENLIFNIF